MSAQGITGNGLGPGYAAAGDAGFVARYTARCRCGAVVVEVSTDPLDAKICHCADCRTLHAAPMQWAAIFRKRDVRLVRGAGALRFYHTALGRMERTLPCKVSCGSCGTPVADEGRSMWLAFPTLFDFGAPPHIPKAFLPTCHIFYAQRVMDVDDDLPKWSGHRPRSGRSVPG